MIAERIVSPYATGASPMHYGSGFLPAAEFWMPGAILPVGLLAIGTPWLLARKWTADPIAG